MSVRIVLVNFLLLKTLQSFGLGENRPNILFIAIDDLRPELGCYGSMVVRSPHLDKLANEGRRFDRAYCQQSICSPSRASLMTGARPDEIGVVENTAYFRELNPKIVTLPQHFIKHGYEAVYCGKIYHGRMTDEELSWSRRPAYNRCKFEGRHFPGGYALRENQEIWLKNKERMVSKFGDAATRGLIHGPAYESAEVADHEYADGFSAQLAIATMKDHFESKPEQPLFLAVGFKKPHLNFVAPKKYWDLYEYTSIDLDARSTGPEGGASTALHASFELRTRHGIPKKGPIKPKLARTLLHGYYACISYVDAQIGAVIGELETLGIRDNTVIVVWGDHGWHLGEMGIWGKATNYEIATRVPLVVWTPSMKERGRPSSALVELVDIYPTLCELAGLPEPEHLAGKSFASSFRNPGHFSKEYAISQFPNPALREWAANPLSPEMRNTFFGPLVEQVERRIKEQVGNKWNRELFENHLMGYSMRTERYRFVAWLDYRDIEKEPVYKELFDHEKDPHETKNIADEFPEVANSLLSRLLRSGIGYAK